MKYVVFILAAFLAVPTMALLAAMSRRGRALVLVLLVSSPALGSFAKINFWSEELYRGPDRGFEVTLTDLAAASLALALLIKPPGKIKWIPPASLVLILYFACAVFSLAWTPEPLYSSFTIFKLLRCGLIYWTVANAVRSRRDLRAVLGGWMIAALVTGGIAFVQKYFLGVWRINGPFDHSNTVPLYLNLVIGPVLMWALADPEMMSFVRVSALASVLGMLFAVLGTFSRAGIALSGLAFGATLCVAAVRAPSRRTLGIAFVAGILALAGAIKAAPRVINRFENAEVESIQARGEFNEAALMMVSDSPLGVGINVFPLVMAQPRYMHHVRVMANEPSPGVVHNIYLLTAAELGICGLLVFLSVLARFLWIAVATATRRVSFESLIAASLAIGMLALHGSGFLEWAFRITPVCYQFAFVAGLTAALRLRPTLERG